MRAAFSSALFPASISLVVMPAAGQNLPLGGAVLLDPGTALKPMNTRMQWVEYRGRPATGFVARLGSHQWQHRTGYLSRAHVETDAYLGAMTITRP